MREGSLRGLGAAVLVAASFGLSVWAGRIGSVGSWRWTAIVALAGVALVTLAFAVPAVMFDDGEAMGYFTLPVALVLIAGTVWLTGVDAEVRGGQWQPVIVMDKHCVTTDSGCSLQYHLSDARTERDLGWLTCDDDALHPGDRARLHVDPAGHHRPALEPCAHTSPSWTRTLHVVWGVWGLVALLAIVGAFVAAFAEW
ncbi:hypothetical protein [Dactylosporangium matsuzakiense]|uniref:Uncharacterized protein n=1 Tax=Dactylosporangium matsuzakiense TaxID=53360 RepID=A0A9W6NQD4_9ACTN|nr:hypothetical protein [Dactylosporangium matsuzakiense]UWZ47732.1 hypothetical protein Dmats_15800 [Dactylosporangium matsuzakiense]GLL06115.1 hypothetical protein GCM10017581_078630 [Dactylosporangium matsuzakiense]